MPGAHEALSENATALSEPPCVSVRVPEVHADSGHPQAYALWFGCGIDAFARDAVAVSMSTHMPGKFNGK